MFKLVSLSTKKEFLLSKDCPLILGRQNETMCTDKRVSRKHVQFTCSDSLTIEPLHVNPCFLKRSGSSSVLILQKNESTTLNDGDCVGLLPNSFWFQVGMCSILGEPDHEGPLSSSFVTDSLQDDTISNDSVPLVSMGDRRASASDNINIELNLLSSTTTSGVSVPSESDTRSPTPDSSIQLLESIKTYRTLPTSMNGFDEDGQPVERDYISGSSNIDINVKPVGSIENQSLNLSDFPNHNMAENSTINTVSDKSTNLINVPPLTQASNSTMNKNVPPCMNGSGQDEQPIIERVAISDESASSASDPPPNEEDSSLPTSPNVDNNKATPGGSIKRPSLVLPYSPKFVTAEKSPAIRVPVNSTSWTHASSKEPRTSSKKTRRLPTWMLDPGKNGQPVAKRATISDDSVPSTNGISSEAEDNICRSPDVDADNRVPSTNGVQVAQDPPLNALSASLQTSVSVVDRSAVKTEPQTSETPSINQSGPPQRPICKFENACYRRNIAHKLEFSHPGDVDFNPPANRPLCRYGSSCYRRNMQHLSTFRHNGDVQHNSGLVFINPGPQPVNYDTDDAATEDDDDDFNSDFDSDLSTSDEDYQPPTDSPYCAVMSD